MSEMSDFIYKTFDKMTLSVLVPVIFAGILPVGAERDNRFNAELLKTVPELIAVISFVGDDSPGKKTGCQAFSPGDITGLPGSRYELQGIAECIDSNMDFGAEPASAAAESLPVLPAVSLKSACGTGTGAGDSAVDNQIFKIRISGAETVQALPYPFETPAGKASVNAVPTAVFLRKKPPLSAASGNPQNGFNEKQAYRFVSGINMRVILKKVQYLNLLIF
jgi:hypothetical protein